MKRFSAGLLVTCLALCSYAQKNKADKDVASGKSLLWKISGNGLDKPSYLFGTIHMLCADDAILSSNFKNIIHNGRFVFCQVNKLTVNVVLIFNFLHTLFSSTRRKE